LLGHELASGTVITTSRIGSRLTSINGRYRFGFGLHGGKHGRRVLIPKDFHNRSDCRVACGKRVRGLLASGDERWRL